ncbi:MAG TPA: MauE/DoxX family redox-associated membrane protein [Candidatus Eisenbacteria bacterium]
MGRLDRFRPYLVVAAALGLAAIWGMAAFLKALDPAAFAEQITQHHVTPAAWSPLLARVFVAIEALLVVAHLSLWRPKWVFAASGILLLLFMGATGLAWAGGHTEGCGCFGRLAARHPREVLLEDAGFLALAAVGFRAAAGFGSRRWSGPVLIALTPLALALPFVGPHLPGDSLVTTFNPGEDLTHLAADDLPQPLDDGKVLLVLMGPECSPCDAGLESLNTIAGTEGAPTVIVVYAGSRNEARSWVLDHVPGFAVGSAPEKVLRQYYRKLPQVGLLDGGRIVKVWRGRVPAPGEITPA